MPLDSRFDRVPRHELGGSLTLFVAGSRRSRMRGLARLAELSPGHALLLAPCRSVHTAGMRFALDLLWLDARGEPVRLDLAVAPHRLRSCGRARAVIECNAGDGERFALAAAGGLGSFTPHRRAAGRASVWISNIAVLLGAELNAETERGRQIEGGMDPEQEPFMELRDTTKLDDD